MSRIFEKLKSQFVKLSRQNMSSDLSRKYNLENRKRLRGILEEIPKLNPPVSWEFQQYSIGGLTEIGFSYNKPHLLLVISSNGRGLFDCSQLEKIDRDYNDEHEIDYQKMRCFGIGLLKEENISIAGLHGGGLPLTNLNHDYLITMALDWPYYDIIFAPKGKSPYSERDRSQCFRIYCTDTLKSYGFSSCGNYFAIGTSSDLFIYKRKLESA
ncbi:hypothetical protein [Flammeovirga kamogawensis]|uniref:Uncharacterized protein n=1 Tax=Flammeovirga kamogawensis TaxID=373891 RepID=A0ABX8H3P5_9BACT|nr:hypothetical protein [Flammeovirga kamogawensis]MBB6461975.1 hypothetical protein [Flammeovirga kamogawensis]QWG10421.1 hypothetical protein KM029_25940 [Flammeovirga kamogawensis]TRX63931.1 hypothetical protein EO216_26315 [Flammeovirga kamogawensis]